MPSHKKYQGLWWLQTDPENKFHGTMSYKPGQGTILKVDGCFASSENGFYVPFNKIIGVTNYGGKITLEDCELIMSGFQESKYFVYKAYIGEHFDFVEQVQFKSLKLQLPYLDRWTCWDPFSQIWGKDGNGVVISYKAPSSIKAIVDCGKIIGNGEIIIGVGGRGVTTIPSRSVTVEQNIEVQFNLGYGLPFDMFYNHIFRPFQDFLSFAVSRPAYPNRINGFTEDEKEVDVLIKFPLFSKDTNNDDNPLILFTLKQINDRFETFIQNWYQNWGDLKPVINLYISALYNPYLYRDNLFLNYMHALESYHRRRFGGKYQTDEVFQRDLYKKLVDAIPNDIDKDYKRSLIKGKLFYANEFSLRRRIKELIKNLPDDYPFDIVKNGKKREEFVENVSDIRNFLTHFSETNKYLPLEGKGFEYLIEKLRILLDIYLLHETGFDFNEIKNMVFKFTQFRHSENE